MKTFSPWLNVFFMFYCSFEPAEFSMIDIFLRQHVDESALSVNESIHKLQQFLMSFRHQNAQFSMGERVR